MLGLISGIIGLAGAAIAGGINAANKKKQQKKQDDLNERTFQEEKRVNDANIENMEWNRNFMENQAEYQKELNQLTMEREDTAVSRRMKDLENAGLSRLFAGGQGASASTMSTGSGSVGGISNSVTNKQAGQAWDLDLGFLSQIGQTFSQIEVQSAQKDLIRQQDLATDVQRRIDEWNLEKAEEWNVPTTYQPTNLEKYFNSITQGIIKQQAEKTYEKSRKEGQKNLERARQQREKEEREYKERARQYEKERREAKEQGKTFIPNYLTGEGGYGNDNFGKGGKYY